MKRVQTLPMRVMMMGLFAGLGFGGNAVSMAQVPTLVPDPFVTSFAGLAPGSGATQCTLAAPILTSKGANVGDGCLPNAATLFEPTATTEDAFNNIYISDYDDHLVRVVYQGGSALTAALIAANPGIANFVPVPGNIYTLAGGATGNLAQTGSPKAYYCNAAGTGTVALGSNGDACPASQAYVTPRGISVDPNGNVFFANLAGAEGMRVIYVGGAAVAKLITTLNATVTTPVVGSIYSITGNTTAGYSGDGSNARTAAFENVRDLAIDSAGDLFISDGNGAGSTTDSDVRRIDAVTGIITTYAGSTAGAAAACPAAGMFGGDGGPYGSAKLNSPYSLFFDASGNLYIADSCNGRLRVIYTGGTVPGLSNLTPGYIYTVVGGGTQTGSGVLATQLSIALLQSAGIDASGNLYVADATNKFIWEINAKTGIAVEIGGFGTTGTAPAAGSYCAGTAGPKSLDSQGDGCPALQAAISPSLRFTFDKNGHMFSVENGNNYVRQYNFNNVFPATAVGTTATEPTAFVTEAATTLSGETFTLQGASTTEFTNAGGNTCALSAALAANTVCVFYMQFAPLQAGVRSGTMQLAGSNSAAALLNLAGTGKAAEASIDPGTQTLLLSGTVAQGVAVDLLGNIYASDGTGNQVLKIATGGTTSSALITGLKQPHQIAVDNAGNVYVADTGNNRIAMVATSGGTVTPLGTGLSSPQGVAVDAVGDVYVADTGNNRIVELLAGGGQQVVPSSGLSGPTQLAIDASGDLYIADTGNSRVVEVPFGTSQSTIALGATAITPVGVAVDAAGDLYVADSAGEQVVELLPGTSSASSIVSSLKAAAGLAIDTNGSLYVADSKAAGVVYFDRALGAIGFPLTNVGQTSNTSISVSDTGNLPLTFTGTPLTTASGVFAATSASSNGCAVGSSVATGTNCQLNAGFTPLAKGSSSQTIGFSTNTANNSAAHALLSGTGAQLVPTSTAIVVTSPAGTIFYGTPVVITATVTLSTPSGTPTGTVTLSVDGKAQAAQPFGTGIFTTTLNLPVGTHAVSATFSGDTVYASSGNSVSFTVVKAVTTTALMLTPSVPGGSATIAFQATVASATATGETGTVSFYAGTSAASGTLLNTVSIGTNGVASYTSSTITFSSGSFIAVYSGDPNFAGSTSAIAQPAPNFAVTTSTSSVAIFQGGVATIGVTITPLFGATGTVTPSCSGLPANALCRFQPTTIALDGTDAVGESVLVYTNVSPSIAGTDVRPGSRWTYAFASLWLLAGLLLLRRGRRTFAGTLALGMVGIVLAAASFTGCSGGTLATTLVTPTGTQTITVTFTGSGTTTAIHPVNFSFTVNGN